MAPTSVTEQSIRELVDKFYARVRDDAVLSPVFESKLADNWQAHMTRMYSFWTKVLLGTGDFQSNVFAKHMALSGIEKDHFVRWLALFKDTSVEIFGPEGAKAPLQVAERIAASLHLGYFGEVAVR